MQPALAGNTGAPYQASSFGPVRTLVLDTTWQDLLGGWEYDLVEIRIPPDSLRVLVVQSDADLTGTVATNSQELNSWILDPGVHPKSVNRASDGPRWFIAVDPTDDLGSARVKVMAAG